MPVVLTQDELSFLRQADRLAREEECNAQEIAAASGVAPGTVTYRLLKAGLRTKTTVQIVDIRTGKPFAELDAAGEFIAADEAPALAGAA